MKINMASNTTNTKTQQQFIYDRAIEICAAYHMPLNEAPHFIYDATGQDCFVKYMKSIGIPTEIIRFREDETQRTVGLIYDFEETEALTVLLLKQGHHGK